MRLVRHVAGIEELTGECTILVGKPDVNNSLERPRTRWEGTIKIYLKELGVLGMDWIDLAQDRDRLL
jgi:hypothetical protein